MTSLHWPSLRRVRLATGLVLFAFVTSHFINHSLGNISVAEMNEGLAVQKWIWQTLPGAIVLYVSMATHMGLGFWALYERRHFRWTRAEAVQLILGLSIPLLLADHVIGTRGALSLFATDKDYGVELHKFWVTSPLLGAIQAVLLLIVWTHGCLGIHFWLRLKPIYARLSPVLLAVAVLLPACALLGYYQGGETVLVLTQDAAWRAARLSPERAGTAAQNALLIEYRTWFFVALAGTFGLVFVGRILRRWREQRRGLISLVYPDRLVRVPRGLSVLEASLRYNIPHAHVCGGRGRCSTCRIRLLGEHGDLSLPGSAEQAVLDRVRAGAAVRLACQLRPEQDLTFVPLLPPQATVANAYRRNQPEAGDERNIVIMFVDMRGSTKLAEHRLPYDTVFIINRFLTAVGAAVVNAGGTPNQILGDGLLALFGLKGSNPDACRQAVRASGLIAHNIDNLNRALRHDLAEPLRFGIGIHSGMVIAGDIGYREHASFTVIGDPVNVAARLQDLTKSFGFEVLMSEEVYAAAGFAGDEPSQDVSVRGRATPLKARGFVSAAQMDARLNGAELVVNKVD
jgi:adenylate cyclase